MYLSITLTASLRISSTAWLADRSDPMCGLAECALAEGNAEEAVAMAEGAFGEATQVGARLLAIPAALSLARSLRAAGAEPGRIQGALDQAESLIRQTGAVSYEPGLREERELVSSS